MISQIPAVHFQDATTRSPVRWILQDAYKQQNHWTRLYECVHTWVFDGFVRHLNLIAGNAIIKKNKLACAQYHDSSIIFSYFMFSYNSPPSYKDILSSLLLSKEKPKYALPSSDFRDASLKLSTSHWVNSGSKFETSEYDLTKGTKGAFSFLSIRPPQFMPSNQGCALISAAPPFVPNLDSGFFWKRLSRRFLNLWLA